jgi:regulator of sirC expression with transglutaminase-like and TPR domain
LISALSSYSSAARELLARALGATPPRLDWAALAVGTLDQPELAIAPVEEALEAFARRVRLFLGGSVDALSQAQALRRVLGEEEGFWGDTEHYDAPENSFLQRVLQRRLGLPITLSVLYLEVARRADIPLFGVAFPGHFLVACEAERGKLVMDPFQGGQVLTEQGCEELLTRVAPQIRFNPRMLVPAGVPAITSRMLNNLKRIYLARSEGEHALQVIDLLLQITPDHPGDLRARAAILASQGAYRAALADLERCLELSPDAPDQETLRMTVRALRQQLELLH